LPVKQAYVVSLNMSVCLDPDSCPITAMLLDDVMLPMMICELDPDYATNGKAFYKLNVCVKS